MLVTGNALQNVHKCITNRVLVTLPSTMRSIFGIVSCNDHIFNDSRKRHIKTIIYNITKYKLIQKLHFSYNKIHDRTTLIQRN